MLDAVIEVRDVIEKNDCAGRKSFYVTAMASDETIPSIYRMNPAWLPPDTKLALASVAQMDRLRVYHHRHSENLLHNGAFVIMDGDFVENLSDVHLRDHLCRCGTRMVSDGFDVHCPNPDCALTLAARLERLGHTEFFDQESVTSDGELIDIGFGRADNYTQFCHPFMFVTQGTFWGAPTVAIEDILLRQSKFEAINLATFLVPDLFDAFLDNPVIPNPVAQSAAIYAQRFYGWMNETVNRRDFYSPAQNRLWAGFLWSLGIESLKPAYFDMLFTYEMCQAINDPGVLYAALLTEPKFLVEAGLHHLEAISIVNEVRRRRFELCDIFSYYALNKDDVLEQFRRLA